MNFKEYLVEKTQDEMLDALYKGLKDDNFNIALQDWFQDNYPDVDIYPGDAVPNDYIELLDRENDKKMITKIYKDLIKKFKTSMSESDKSGLEDT